MNGSNSDDLKELVDRAAEQLRIGDLYRWTRVELANALHKEPVVRRLSPIFFALTLNALRDESILHLTRLVERNHDTLNLQVIKTWIEGHEGCFVPRLTPQQVRGEVLPELGAKIKTIEISVDKIVRVRDKEIAHLNRKQLMGGTKNEAGEVTYLDIEKAYRDVHETLDWLSEKCLGQGIGLIEILASGDFRNLLEWAQEGFESEVESLRIKSSSGQ